MVTEILIGILKPRILPVSLSGCVHYKVASVTADAEAVAIRKAERQHVALESNFSLKYGLKLN
jgi:hypothetical protein